MNTNTKLQLIRDLVQSKIMELQPFAGEEVNLLQTDPHRDGFVAGERALAAQILDLLKRGDDNADLIEEDMILSLGQT